jgi:hypothetical protein
MKSNNLATTVLNMKSLIKRDKLKCLLAEWRKQRPYLRHSSSNQCLSATMKSLQVRRNTLLSFYLDKFKSTMREEIAFK